MQLHVAMVQNSVQMFTASGTELGGASEREKFVTWHATVLWPD